MAARRDAEKAAERELQRLNLWGARRDVSPIEALGEELERTAGRVAAIEQRLASLTDDQADSLRARGLAAELSQERGQLQRVAEAAARAGVPERRVAVGQEQALQIASALRGVLADLELTERQQAAVAELTRWHFGVFTGGPSGPRPPRPSELPEGSFFDAHEAARQFRESQSGEAAREQRAIEARPAATPVEPDGAQLLELRAAVARRRGERDR